MKIKINPSTAVGTVQAPPSKSIAHRALICGALSGGSVIRNLAFSKDVSATVDCLSSLGASISVNENTVSTGGLDIFDPNQNAVLNCNESGSTLRFLIPLCLVSGKKTTFIGSKRLFERPLTIYENICREQGIFFELHEDSVTVCGELNNGFYKIPGNISSQFITGLLFTLPLLNGTSILEITGDFESASYVDLTLDVLKEFGVRIIKADNRFIIQGNQSYRNTEYVVEGDCSNAAFLEALNFLGGDVKINGISDHTRQGDRVYTDMFASMKNGVTEFDLSDCPDLAPIMFAVASTVGNIRFTGTSRLKIKESDRAIAMQTELKKFGIEIDVDDNSVYIKRSTLTAPTETLFGHNDHRIVMSLAVLSTLTGGIVDGAESVSKSYPDFFEVAKTLGIGILENETR
jgi:3-phosphoshikimate 1-carboxyvinyltransferase